MTKEEFMGFSSAAQHDMVLEALVRVTKNLDVMAEESGKPFVGTSKQRRNDVKLLAILAEAFGKNELVWASAGRSKESRNDLVNITIKGKVVGVMDRDAAIRLLDKDGVVVHADKNAIMGFDPDGSGTYKRMSMNEYMDEKFSKNNKES